MHGNIYNTNAFVGRLRKKANLSQNELGEIMSIGQSSVCAWEKHLVSPSVKRMKQLVEIGARYGLKTSIALLRKEYGVE